MKVLITGATGNVGREVINSLKSIDDVTLLAAVRNIERAKVQFQQYNDLVFRTFDFDDFNTFNNALVDIDIVFLLRPPHISDIEKYFIPLFDTMMKQQVRKIVFLSVQGAEKSKVIPHNKIERLMNEYDFEVVNLRPSYFMQNLTTTLKKDVERKMIMLPSKEAKFNWIDIKDIGDVAAKVISDFEAYKGNDIELTGKKNMSFKTVVERINDQLDLNITYKSVNPIKYYRYKKSEGYEKGQIIVMLLLHFLPRFQKEPVISDHVKEITGHKPILLEEFIERNSEYFTL